MTIRMLVTSGSSRTGSLNRQLASYVAGVARAAGAEVTELDLGSLGMVVVPETASIGQAHQAFDARGALQDAQHQQAVVRSVLMQAGVR